MTHNQVHEVFKGWFPEFLNSIEMWFPNGKNSIRVRLYNKKEIVFTVNGIDDWSLESVDSFLKRMERRV